MRASNDCQHRRVALLLVSFSLLALADPLVHALPQPSAAQVVVPDASINLAPVLEDLEAIQADVQILTDLTEELLSTTRQETIFTKIRDDFLSNLLWEVFGFKSTEKTIVGIVLSILGILGVLVRVIIALRKNSTEPPWFRFLMLVYLALVVIAMAALTFSGGIAREVSNPEAAANRLANRVRKLESTTDQRLRDIEASIDDALKSMTVVELPVSQGDPSSLETSWAGLAGIETAVQETRSLAEEAARHARSQAQGTEELLRRASEPPSLTKWLLFAVLTLQSLWLFDILWQRRRHRQLASAVQSRHEDQ